MPKTRRLTAWAIQGVAGVLLGGLPYFLAWQVLFSDDHLPAPGHKILFGLIFGFWIVTGALVAQGLMTAFFLLGKLRVAAVSVWLVYPVLFVSVVGNLQYVQYREGIAAREDYSSRELKRPNGEIRDLLLVISGGISDSSGFYQRETCEKPCISLLRADVLESVAVPTEEQDGGFKVFRHARGEACAVAERNYERHRELERMRESMARQIVRLERELTRNVTTAERRVEDPDKLPYVAESRRNLEIAQDSARQVELQFLETFEIPRAFGNGYDSPTEFGHLDECITTSVHRSFDYDIRIEFGDHLSRPYGPIWGIAEIYGVEDGAPFLIARFEAGNRRQFRGEPISIADIIADLTGRPFDPELAPYPVDNVGSELARLAALIEGGAYVGNWFDLTHWINKVFRRARGGSEGVHLSAADIGNLILIKQAGPEVIQERFIGEIDNHLTQQSIDALIGVGAAGEISLQPSTDR